LLGEEFFKDEQNVGIIVALGGGGGSSYMGATSGIKAGLPLLEIHSSKWRNLSKNSLRVL